MPPSNSTHAAEDIAKELILAYLSHTQLPSGAANDGRRAGEFIGDAFTAALIKVRAALRGAGREG